MSENKEPNRLAVVDRRVSPSGNAKDAQSSWLMRGHKGAGRHAAITKNLYNWHSYKSWADKARNSWEDPDKKP